MIDLIASPQVRELSNAATVFPGDLLTQLDRLLAEERVSRAIALQAAYRMMLRRFSGHEEMLIRVGGRSGFYDVQATVTEETSFRQALRLVDIADARTRSAVLADDILTLSLAGEVTETLSSIVDGDRLLLSFAGSAKTTDRIDAFVEMIASAVAEPDTRGSSLRMCNGSFADMLLAKADGPCRTEFCHSPPLDVVVADRAAAAPGSIAVIEGDRSTTYADLYDRVRVIAQTLDGHGIVPGSCIGVCADASADFFASILAIWSAGAVYVPLDPIIPADRLATIVRNARVKLALVSRAYATVISDVPTIELESIRGSSSERRASRATPDGIAYVLFTSGSTGEPKGVEITHRAAANAITSAIDVCGFGPSDTTLYRTAISFDLSLYEIFCSLASGGSLVAVPRVATGDPHALIDLIVIHGVSHLLLGPALLAAILERRAFERCSTLRVVTCGGEALPWTLCERFFTRSSATLYNLYGPSEATILVTLHPCAPADETGGEATAFLGRPLANTHVSVRDELQWPVPPGAIGEITIGGAQLARGYVGRPDETNRRFVNDPARPGERLYRSGDLARLHADGSIVYLGRNDRQVKIRGSRVEPAEVAAAIERIDGVRSAVVCAQHRSSNTRTDTMVLVAYVVLRAGISMTIEEIRAQLRSVLPAYMIPIDVCFLASFPLTVSGKIDEKALISGAMRAGSLVKGSIDSNSTLLGILREQIRTVWQELLGRSAIGDYDDFIEIGGDSLLAIQLMLRIEEMFGQQVALVEFFGEMTIAALAALLARDAVAEERDAFVFNENGALPPLVYLHGDFAGGRYAWSLATMLGSDQPLTVIAPHGLQRRRPVTSVELMAHDVVESIELLHPYGPLRIGGFSAAGLVAFEVARMLSSRGRIVLDVVLVATTAENAKFAALGSISHWLPLPQALRETFLRMTIGRALAVERFVRLPFGRKLRFVVQAVSRKQRSLEPALPLNELELSDDYTRYVAAHAAYIPGLYAGDLTILWPSEEDVVDGDLLPDWQRIAPCTTVESVSGTHLGAVARHLDEIAAAMRHKFSANSVHDDFISASPV